MATAPDLRERVSQFVSQEYGKVVASVILATRDRDRADDAVQDAVVAVLTSDSPPDNIAAWVTVVAINNVRMAHRREGAQGRAYDKLPDAPAVSADAATEVVDAVTVHDAIAALPAQQQEVVALYYYLDTPVASIAAALQVSDGTVKTQLHRARKALASTLGKEAW